MSRGGRKGEEGFVLAETLIAVAIIAGMTAVAFEAVAGDARVARAMRTRREAVMLAQSTLAQGAAGQGPDEGRWGAFAWSVARVPYDAGGVSGAAPLQRVAVRVADARTGRPIVTLQTLRIER